MEILNLTLLYKWYDYIETDDKDEEYREFKPYWISRILNKYHSHVRFRRGYTQSTMTYRIINVYVGYGKPEWGAPTDRAVIIIKFNKDGKIDR